MAKPRATERDFKRAAAAWPSYLTDSQPAAWKAWQALDEQARSDAVDRASAYIAACRRDGRNVCAFGVYLAERRWTGIPVPIEAPAPKVAAPFGKVWTGRWIVTCLAGPRQLPQPTAFIARLIAEGGDVGERERLGHQSRHGFPACARMAEAARERGFGCVITADEAWMESACESFEQVHVRSDRAADWRAEFERRGWPWLPDPGRHEWLYFPAGGPERLDAFEVVVRRNRKDDDGRPEAAE